MRFLLAISLLLSAAYSSAQHNLLSLNRLRHVEYEAAARHVDSVQHTAMRPYLESKWNLSKVYGHELDTTKYYYK
ncbi:MAG: hypothetical protein HKN32_06885, partial [Flavobacteriales bacterium]|nr:hypothetical protein [Flavobacteriales bacterium]